MSTWEKVANFCAQVYGVFVDWDERFFECPECGEPIYEDDWPADALKNGCPVCEFEWEEE